MDITNQQTPAMLPIIEPQPIEPAMEPLPIPTINTIPVLAPMPAPVSNPNTLSLSMIPDLGAQVLDIGSTYTDIDRNLIRTMSNLIALHWGPNLDPQLLSTVLPDRYINLFLPQGFATPVTDLNLSIKVQLFIHYRDALTVGPTSIPFFLWKEDCEPFTFESLAGLTFHGESMYDGRLSYLKVYKPERPDLPEGTTPPPRIIPNATTPSLDLLKHHLDLANAKQSIIASRQLDRIITETEPRIVTDPKPVTQQSSLCYRSPMVRMRVQRCSNPYHRHKAQSDPNPLPLAVSYAQSPHPLDANPLHQAVMARRALQSQLQPLTVQYYQNLCETSNQNDQTTRAEERAARVKEEGQAIVVAIDTLIKDASARGTLRNGFAYSYTPRPSEYICDLLAFLTKYLPCCKITTELITGSTTNHQIIFTNRLMPRPEVTMTAIPRPE